MPPPFFSTLLLYSILFLALCCLFADADADLYLDSSAAADYYYAPPPPPPSTNLLAFNDPNLDFSTPTTTTTTTTGTDTTAFGNGLQSSSQQQQLPEQEQANAYDDGGWSISSSSASTGTLLLSSDECDKVQKNNGGQSKRRRRRQSRNCPNPYLKTPSSPANSVKTREGDEDDNGRTQRESGQAPTMAIPGLLLQTKPQPNLSVCPEVERPIPVCSHDDAKVAMGDSWLIRQCRPCKRNLLSLFFTSFSRKKYNKT